MDQRTKRYTLNSYIYPSRGRTEVFIEETKPASFYLAVKDFVGAFLNTCGGVVHFGVKNSGRVKGLCCTRYQEDEYRLELDNIMKFFQPKVSPGLYRLDFVPIVSPVFTADWKVISLHVSAGLDVMYMDSSERVMTISSHGLYGPLRPQEIQRLVIHKYKQELLNAENLMRVITPCPRYGRHTKKLDKRAENPANRHKSYPAKKATSCTLSTQTTPLPRPPPVSSLADGLSTQTTPGLMNNSHNHCADETPVTSSPLPQECHGNSTETLTSTPCSGDDSVIILDSTVITVSDSDSDSDSSVIVLDATGNATPVRSPNDLFASPGCSTVKKRPQERQDPQSPSRFPSKPGGRSVGPSHCGGEKASNRASIGTAKTHDRKKLRKS